MDFGLILQSLPELARGASLTLQLAVVALFLSTSIALPLALLKKDGGRIPVAILSAYSYVMRGTPLLVQIFIIYYGLGQIEALRKSFLWVAFREPYFCAVLALVLNAVAYQMEIFSGAFAAIPRGEIEAGKALGLTRWHRLRLILLPRALRIALASYGNEIILMIKATSLASTITLLDLTGVARILVARTYAPYEIFIGAALFYLLFSLIVVGLFHWLEARWKY
jgi:octopine/nopaline transport system permease protein